MTAVGVATAGEALEALRAAVAAGQPFHLVLTDALMPEVDGVTLAEQIAADPQLKAVKIVLLSSAGAPALRGGAPRYSWRRCSNWPGSRSCWM